jgi:CubicO group peptidase (beta-lactamase class C family)
MRHSRLQVGAPNVQSYKSFDNFSFRKSDEPYCFSKCDDRKCWGTRIKVNKALFNDNPVDLETFLESTPTLSFTIIRNDSLLYEYYAKDCDENSMVTSFSVAKSFVSALLGVAIKEGYIQNTEEPITKYLPELLEEDPRFANIKIRHLLNHVSGIDFPSITWIYYSQNHSRVLKKMRYDLDPGETFRYDNGNTMLVTFIIERATGRKFQDYFNEKIWKKIGAESEMLWSMDGEKQSSLKTFCCLNGLARDFAKFGRLYLHRGNWNGEQVIPESWIDESIKWDMTDNSAWDNEYFWWLGPKEYGYYYAAGLYGQYIIVYPKKNVIITRFAKRNLHLSIKWADQILEILDQL